MTTFVAFAPNNSNNPPFSTPLTLDSAAYVGSVTWNIAGKRWYLTILDSGSNQIWSGAMIGSPLGYNILLAPGVFSSSTILYREDTGNLEINP
jgi:hypothetical protein